ncbi:hypothetical protein CR513_04310, partial [Mucuna pruriens]
MSAKKYNVLFIHLNGKKHFNSKYLSKGKICGVMLMATPLHGDNTNTIQIATNSVYLERMKHIKVDCHSIQEVYDSRVLSLPHVLNIY